MELWQEMVRDSVHTVDAVVEKFGIDRKTAEDLFKERNDRITYEIGTMIEVPRAAVVADRLAKCA